MSDRRCRTAGSWSLSLVLLAALAVTAQETSADEAELEEGERLYRVHCVACHGDQAKGDGSMADQLETPPPDLTRIAHRNQGKFPPEKVFAAIDGRRELPAHGTREMPVWGFSFQATGLDSDQEAEVQGRINSLTRYLESIQLPPED